MVPLLIVLIVLVASNVFAETQTCGTDKIDTNPTEQPETDYGQYPWLVALEYTMAGTSYSVGIKCGGALITNRFVLTAAQCLDIEKFEISNAWLGVRKLSDADTTDKDKVKRITIEKIISHENYNALKSENDIALLKLSTAVVFSDYIDSICVPDKNAAVTDAARMVISGWGQSKLCGPTSDIKLHVNVVLYSHANCIDNWNLSVKSNQICTSGDSLQGSCWSDTGAPIMESQPFGIHSRWFVTGIVTSNEICNQKSVVAHTRVSSYATWIEQKIATLS